jgi:hypothetical protein
MLNKAPFQNVCEMLACMTEFTKNGNDLTCRKLVTQDLKDVETASLVPYTKIPFPTIFVRTETELK